MSKQPEFGSYRPMRGNMAKELEKLGAVPYSRISKTNRTPKDFSELRDRRSKIDQINNEIKKLNADLKTEERNIDEAKKKLIRNSDLVNDMIVYKSNLILHTSKKLGEDVKK